jgi:hypothetical protein
MPSISFDKVKVITVGKVGSSDFLWSEYNECTNISHDHDLSNLRLSLVQDNNCLIIVGIRNPIDRNLSYLFQTYSNDRYNDVRTKHNDYKGEYCYIPEMNLNTDIDKVIELYFNQKYHNTFNEWFEEFFEITEIDKNTFDKAKGLSVYNFPNNNTIVIYTLEKLNQNKNNMYKLIGIKDLIHSNNSDDRDYKKMYADVKDKIEYTKEYIDNLLNTRTMQFFYTQADIDYMYSKYKIK